MNSRKFRGLTGVAASAIAALIAIAGTQSAQAQGLKIGDKAHVTNVGITGTDPVTISDPTAGYGPENTWATAILFTINGKQVVVNCDDLWHNVYLGSADTYTVAAFSGLTSSPNYGYPGVNYDPAQIAEMSWLVAASAQIYASGVATPTGTDGITTGGATSTQDLGALQLASWEIGNPDAVFTGESSITSNLASEYMGYVTAQEAANDLALPKGYIVYQLVAFAPNNVQAQIFAEAVPEPATWAMFLTGFAALGFVLRGRRKTGALLTA